jgi:pimeloyl-ACP methyl ester carboxylesterase
MLGTNDTKPKNWAFKARFADDYRELVEKFRALKTRPEIFLCTPPYVTKREGGINETSLLEQIPIIRSVAAELNLAVIDNHKITEGRDELFFDHVHPNNNGATVLAKNVYESVAGKPFAGEVPDTWESEWQGFVSREFVANKRYCRLVFPKTSLPGNPWIWRTEFFGAFPVVDIVLLRAGYHVAYVDARNLYGAPRAVAIMDAFYAHMVSVQKMSARPVLEGFSRGGLYALNWAARNPGKVSVIYLDAAVCDFKSWPGGKGKGDGAPGNWKSCLLAYGLTEEQALNYPLNPVDNLAPLARAGIPIIAVYGEADTTVPPEENSLVVEKRYKELGGTITLIAKPGVKHHPHSLADPTPVVEFILQNRL